MTTHRKIKVSVPVSLDIDPEEWDLNYGTGTSAAAIRESVRLYVRELLRSCTAAQEGSISEVRIGSTVRLSPIGPVS